MDFYRLLHPSCWFEDEFERRDTEMLRNIELDLKEIYRNNEAPNMPYDASNPLIIKKCAYDGSKDWRVYFLSKQYPKAIYGQKNGVIRVIDLFCGEDKSKLYIDSSTSDRDYVRSVHMINDMVSPFIYIDEWVKNNTAKSNGTVSLL